MLAAAFWGFVGGAALLVGAVIALTAKVSPRIIGLVMAFGAGVLISAVAFELTQEAYDSAGGTSVVVGLAAGALVYFVGDWWVDSGGGHRRKSPTGEQQAGAGGMSLVLGALLDGIPESAAIGVSLLGGGKVGLPMVAAVFLSNVPESLSATAGLKAAGRSTRYIVGLWSAVCLVSALAAALGYALLGGASESVVATIQAFAAGAIITMLADTMVPEATEHAGRWVGLFTMLGFAAAFLLSKSA
ncbi:ZIP family metal transporter [uncultured Arsenicicoccus sp.]|uniref:ZIP family metal transporter n=1 Tax=uncultured Arsenicicoccus sp. TaxID=491339 RepID=UPI002599FD9C|nr:ZIP family zinc transporter [uncultured Arsenicicoccus sp.]